MQKHVTTGMIRLYIPPKLQEVQDLVSLRELKVKSSAPALTFT